MGTKMSDDDYDDRYQDLRELGRGGLGVVVSALDSRFGREVAIKRLLNPDEQKWVDRFETEALVTGRLEHSGIPAVYDKGEGEDGPYYVMRQVTGETLSEALDRCEGLNERLQLLPDLASVAQTLGFAHSRGVIHRDIKPDNIILGDHGQTFVLDWGIAKSVGVEFSESDSGGGTVEGSILGTPAYMSPEQAMGQVGRIDFRTDVFALGTLLYHVLSGQQPYSGPSGMAIVMRAGKADFEPLSKVAADAPLGLCQICEKAMALSPVDRYQSASEFAQALLDFSFEAVVNQRQVSVPRIGMAVVSVIVGTLLAVLGAGGSYILLKVYYDLSEAGVRTMYVLPNVTMGVLFAIGIIVVGANILVKGQGKWRDLLLGMAAITTLVSLFWSLFEYGFVLRHEEFAQVMTYYWTLTGVSMLFSACEILAWVGFGDSEDE
jgi:serine/threonine protein kinase